MLVNGEVLADLNSLLEKICEAYEGRVTKRASTHPCARKLTEEFWLSPKSFLQTWLVERV